MKITAIRSDRVYLSIANAPSEQKNDIYRKELMKPFERKWACYGIPMKAATPDGFDVIKASAMYGYLPPTSIDETTFANIKAISSDKLWLACEESIQKSLDCFTNSGIKLPVQEYLFSILLADETNPYLIMSDGYCGDGGIPGYLLSFLVPNDNTIEKLPAVFAHETNHNVRFQFIQWNSDITLGEMIVNEGIADNFAAHLYGEEKAGPWVTKTDEKTLNTYIKPIIRDHLNVRGLQNLNAYLYGDDLAALQHCPPVGLPYCAGYACGYHLIKHYLNKTGKSIVDITLLPATEILEATDDFWDKSNE